MKVPGLVDFSRKLRTWDGFGVNYVETCQTYDNVRNPQDYGGFSTLSEEKKAEMDRVTIKNDVLRKYFPRSYTPKQMQDTIIKLLEQWQKKRQRSQER